MYKLKTESCYNPYLIHNGTVRNIKFYDDNGVISQTDKGWFGNNRIDILEFNDLEFKKRLKINLENKDNFFIKSDKQESFDRSLSYDIYIYIPDSNLIVEPLGECLAMETDATIYYGIFFNLTATFNDRYDFSVDTHERRKFMRSMYSRSVKTAYGLKIDSIKKLLKKDNYSYSVDDIVKNLDSINKIMTD